MTYHIIRTLWKLMSLLPMGVLHFFSDLIYFPLYYVARYRRKVVHTNLTNAFPEKSEQEIIKIEKKFYSAFCDYIVENLKLMDMNPEKAKKYAQLLYSQALLIAGLPLEDPSAYTDLVCELMK